MYYIPIRINPNQSINKDEHHDHQYKDWLEKLTEVRTVPAKRPTVRAGPAVTRPATKAEPRTPLPTLEVTWPVCNSKNSSDLPGLKENPPDVSSPLRPRVGGAPEQCPSEHPLQSQPKDNLTILSFLRRLSHLAPVTDEVMLELLEPDHLPDPLPVAPQPCSPLQNKLSHPCSTLHL